MVVGVEGGRRSIEARILSSLGSSVVVHDSILLHKGGGNVIVAVKRRSSFFQSENVGMQSYLTPSYIIAKYVGSPSGASTPSRSLSVGTARLP